MEDEGEPEPEQLEPTSINNTWSCKQCTLLNTIGTDNWDTNDAKCQACGTVDSDVLSYIQSAISKSSHSDLGNELDGNQW